MNWKSSTFFIVILFFFPGLQILLRTVYERCEILWVGGNLIQGTFLWESREDFESFRRYFLPGSGWINPFSFAQESSTRRRDCFRKESGPGFLENAVHASRMPLTAVICGQVLSPFPLLRIWGPSGTTGHFSTGSCAISCLHSLRESQKLPKCLVGWAFANSVLWRLRAKFLFLCVK